jgi:predicted house-cleaning NTP pyrophosphatase (Maf/HAM1 superfamily)
MRAYSDDEIAGYVNSGDPLDKAGAYAIQHAGFHPVENFTGCFASVMGLPLCHLKRTLKAMGWELKADIAGVCLERLAYDCPIHQQVLNDLHGK